MGIDQCLSWVTEPNVTGFFGGPGMFTRNILQCLNNLPGCGLFYSKVTNYFSCAQEEGLNGYILSVNHCILVFRFGNGCFMFNPFNAETTIIESTKMQRFLKTTKTLSCWYSLESFRRVLSDEYPFARVSVTFYDFLHDFVLDKLTSNSIRVKSVRSNFATPVLTSTMSLCPLPV